MNYFFVFFLKLYKFIISPFFGASCRFYPSCSDYAIEAFSNFGFLRAFYLSIVRILKCNKWNDGGVDLLPTCNETRNHSKEKLPKS
tara:strand:- start:382 stop:639 length:258 start_codon:yes stop_codon:yes gene_type:complete